MEPRFAQPGSFEFSFASKWKQIVEMEKSQMEQVKRNVEEAKMKLEGEMETAQMEHQEELLRKGQFVVYSIYWLNDKKCWYSGK